MNTNLIRNHKKSIFNIAIDSKILLCLITTKSSKQYNNKKFQLKKYNFMLSLCGQVMYNHLHINCSTQYSHQCSLEQRWNKNKTLKNWKNHKKGRHQNRNNRKGEFKLTFTHTFPYKTVGKNIPVLDNLQDTDKGPGAHCVMIRHATALYPRSKLTFYEGPLSCTLLSSPFGQWRQ